jgi:hypothetical protein
MSLNHILDTARKLGIPVVITNERGESPQVVMPFEDFASMVGVSRPITGKPRVTDKVEAEEGRDEIAQALADLTIERIEHEVEEPVSPSGAGAPEASDERFLEDNFYFEPLEDKESS